MEKDLAHRAIGHLQADFRLEDVCLTKDKPTRLTNFAAEAIATQFKTNISPKLFSPSVG
jgi:hypothetical protein